ncbi:MAG: T9SS type A sorting domain-containing protein [Bacteroidetes bacterium]|nr:T9SS type A sorting domain-containing protein [Bacteroidota bacterium]
MKKSLLIFSVLFVALCLNFSNVFTYATGAPDGMTGAPGDSKCSQTSCHTGNSDNTAGGTLTVQMKDSAGNVVTQYKPGKLHIITVTVAKSGTAAWGFETSVRSKTTANFSGSFPSTNTTDVQFSNNQYATHTTSGSAKKTWQFNWTAPSAGRGNVTVYTAANMADGNNSSSNDFIYTNKLTLGENTTGIQENNSVILSSSVFPNPVKDKLNVSFTLAQNTLVEANLVTLNGAVVQRLYLSQKEKGTHALSFNMDEMPAGIYLLQLTANSSTTYKKIVKQ